MKICPSPSARRAGFALLLVMILAAASLLILASSIYRSNTVANLNKRNNDLNTCANAAEAAVEKVFGRMAYDFQSYGVGRVSDNCNAYVYATNIPTAGEDPYWSNFQFSDGNGHSGQTYVALDYNYSGNLPSAYSGLFTSNAPVYRIVSNVQFTNATGNLVVGTAQEEVLLALVPLNTWAIFYNGTLEFSMCAPMVVNGRVQANGPIDVGTISSSSLTFNGLVNSTTNISAPNLDGSTTANWNPATPSTWNTTFPGGSTQYGASVTTSLSMTNSHFMIDFPNSSQTGVNATIGSTNAQMLYNEAQIVLVVTNSTISATNNPTVSIILQAPLGGNLPGNDPLPNTSLYFTNQSPAALSTNLPFLSLTNTMYDDRESNTNNFTQIDVGKLATWLTNNSTVQGKLPASSGVYPTILYVADRRTWNSQKLPSVRLMNAAQLPANGGAGFTVATPNPLYVQGNYNTQTSAGSSVGTNNAYEVPAALMSDALTILSPNWTDNKGAIAYTTTGSTFTAATMTINAAIVTGTVPSTDATTTGFSGGVHNLPRMLEDWSGINLYLNTSIIRLWNSQMATNQWKYQGTYYNPPNRYFSFDNNYLNPAKVPPGIPVALVPLRFAWTVPPPGTITWTNWTHD